MKNSIFNAVCKTRYLALLVVLIFTCGNAWGAEVAAYTLTCSTSGSNNSYGGNCDVTVGGITWNVNGNSQQNPWRFGGQSITSVTRTLYSKTAIDDDITKIAVAFGAKSGSGITINSVTLEVYSSASLAAAKGTGDVSSHTIAYAASTTRNITVPDGKSWEGRYYCLKMNVTVSGSSNKYISVSSITFYKQESTCTKIGAPTVTATPGDRTITLTWANQTGSSSYNVTKTPSGGTVGTPSKSGSTWTCEISGLTNGTAYTWSVEAVGSGDYCASGNTAASSSTTPNATYTITYHDKDGSHTTTLTEGTNIATALNALYGVGGPTSCDAVNYEYFYGWKVGTISGSTTTAPTILSTETASADAEYYAVWTDADPSSGSWEKLTSLSASNIGDEVVFAYDAGYKEMTGINASNYGNATAVDPYPDDISGSYTLTIEAGHGGTGYSFKHGSVYLSWSSGNSLTTSSTKNDASSWTISESSSGNFKFANVGTTARILQYNSGSPRWACYGNSDQSAFQIYKQSAGGDAVYITTCCSDPGLAYGTGSVTKTFGASVFTNTLTNSHNVAVTYASSDPTVATVNGSGQVTILKAGSTTITASSVAQTVSTVDYCADEASYTLTVNKASISPTLTYSPASVAVGEYSATPTVGGNTGSGTVTYAITSASPAGCASINTSTGVVTGLAVGSVTVTATVGATANYNGNTATATVTITAASNFPNNKTIFIQAHSTSAWTGGGCVKAWFHTAGGSEAAQTTYWLFDAGSPDEGKKLFAAIVPSTGNLPYLDIQRFAANCSDWWNKNGGCSYADADGSNAVRSTGKNDDASDGDYVRWNDDAVTLSLYGDPNSWGSSLASFSDQGNGVWTATYSNYAPENAAGESQDFKICTNYNGWIGNTGSNNNVTVSDMHVGSTYNIGASLDIKDHSLTLTKTFVKGTVHFNMKGHGSAISDLTNVAAGSKISAPSPAPTAAGYRFVGWYKEDACTNAWNFGSDVVNETMTLYAKWVQTFTVTYNSNGGSGSMTDSNSPYDSDATVTVKSNSFTAPTGKEFNHWDTKDDDTGTDYAPAATFTISANTTLYAQWSFVNYNVTYSAPSNGNYTIKVADGTASSATKTANYNQTITIAATPSANYRFGSWTIRNTSTSADVTSTLLTGDKPTTASTTFTMPAYGVTITATFVQTHTVSWKSNGADYISPVTYDHGGTLVLPSPNPSAPAGCSSKVFMGWTSDPEITVATSDAPSYISAGGAVNADATYRAVFADKDDSGGSATTTITDASSWSKKGTSGGGTPGTTGLGTIVIGDVVTLNIQKCYVSTGDIRIYKDYDITFETATSAQKITYIRFNTMADAGSSYQAKNLQAWIDDGTGNNTEDPHGSDVYNSSTTKWDYVWDNSTGATSVLLTATERTDLGSITVSYTSVSYDNYITLCSSCTTPSDLEVSSITSTGGTVSWDGVSAVAEVGGSGTGFTVLWGTDPVRANNSNTANVAAGTNEYAITGLTPATRYYVWVQSKCNDEWSSSTNFYTNAKITYAAGTGASGLMDPKEVTYNTNVTVDACTFTAPSGKVFNGWVSDQAVTVSAVSTTSVPDGATITGLTKAITLTAQWRDLAVYHVTFSADNGTVAGGASQDVLEGGTLTFPNVTSTTCGTFSGWVEAAYDNTAAPSGATYHAVGDELAADPSMDGKTYYAVYHVAMGAPTTTTDVLVYSDFNATGSSYVATNNLRKSSAAVYEAVTAQQYSGAFNFNKISDARGIVTPTSGGVFKSITLTTNTNHSVTRKVYVYGSSSYTAAYADPAAFKDNSSVRGTLLATLEGATKTYSTSTDDYEYIAIFADGAAYMDQIDITWYGAPMKYQTSPACSPVISMTSSFSSFTYVYGSGPSASQSFTVSGANLGANLVVTAPANYEVCKTSGGTYTSSVSYTPSDGTVTDQTVYIRLAGGLNVGTYNYAAASGVSAASTGATTRTAALNGSVTKAAGAIAFTDFNAVDHYEAELTGSSVDVTLTVSVTGDGSVSYTRSPAAGSSAVPATTPTTTLHTTTTGTWTVTATLTAGTNYTGSSTSCQVVVYKADRFYDNVHGNDMILKRNDTGEDHYTIPTLTDESRLLSGSCSETHYHFMGWVPESALSSLPNDAAYDAVMITGGGTQSATGTNYYAVWAEE